MDVTLPRFLDLIQLVDDNERPGSSTDGRVLAHSLTLMLGWSRYHRMAQDEAKE